MTRRWSLEDAFDDACDRLATFIVDHIGRPYTGDECGRVLELRPMTAIEHGIARAVARDERWHEQHDGWV